MGTPLYSYLVQPQVLFDGEGVKQALNVVALTQTLGVGTHSALSFTEQNLTFAGRQQTVADSSRVIDFLDEVLEGTSETADLGAVFGINAAADHTPYLTDSWAAQVAFSTVHRTGPGYYERGGVQVALLYGGSYQAELEYPADGAVVHLLSPSVQVRLPHLVPVHCGGGTTYNLPLVLEAAYTPSSSKLFSFGK